MDQQLPLLGMTGQVDPELGPLPELACVQGVSPQPTMGCILVNFWGVLVEMFVCIRIFKGLDSSVMTYFYLETCEAFLTASASRKVKT